MQWSIMFFKKSVKSEDKRRGQEPLVYAFMFVDCRYF